MSDPITVVAYDIGSTAVPGLAAKPIVDVQISVERLEPVEPFRLPLEAAGFLYRASNTERTKRYFREPPGRRRTHLHVRRAGSFSEEFPLLFRDFLRADPAAALDYGQRKRALAAGFADDRRGYLEAKLPITWDVLRRADQWAQHTGWEPGPSDA
jgi:GrpB-like predicted nucleotidyltransferase (UPF0157 family)